MDVIFIVLNITVVLYKKLPEPLLSHGQPLDRTGTGNITNQSVLLIIYIGYFLRSDHAGRTAFSYICSFCTLKL